MAKHGKREMSDCLNEREGSFMVYFESDGHTVGFPEFLPPMFHGEK
jgi:hypothetical protein